MNKQSRRSLKTVSPNPPERPQTPGPERISSLASKSNDKKNLIDKKTINRAFGLMRKAGLLAKQNYTCCTASAMVNLSFLAARCLMRGEPCIGFVSYHQGDEDLRQQGENFWLQYWPSMDQALSPSMTLQDIAMIICDCLVEAEVRFHWNDGFPERIEIVQKPRQYSVIAEENRIAIHRSAG